MTAAHVLPADASARSDSSSDHQRLEAMKSEFDEFVAVISHDFRAPIRGILAMSDWLAAELPQDALTDDTREYLTLMRERAFHLRDMLDAVTEMARFGRLFETTQTLSLTELASQACNAAMIPEGFQVTMECGSERVTGAGEALVKALACLLDNAWRHHPSERGTIVVRLAVDHGTLAAEVLDDGEGFPEERASQLQKLFRNGGTPRNKQRLGVGLAYVRRLTLSAGGAFSLTRRQDQASQSGTSARLEWPNWNFERT